MSHPARGCDFRILRANAITLVSQRVIFLYILKQGGGGINKRRCAI